jgi:hypothetical protein
MSMRKAGIIARAFTRRQAMAGGTAAQSRRRSSSVPALRKAPRSISG